MCKPMTSKTQSQNHPDNCLYTIWYSTADFNNSNEPRPEITTKLNEQMNDRMNDTVKCANNRNIIRKWLASKQKVKLIYVNNKTKDIKSQKKEE